MSEATPRTTEPVSLHGPNAAYALELFERWRQDPTSVDPQSRALFEHGLVPAAAEVGPAAVANGFDIDRVIRVARLARLIRELGHAEARLDPLGSPPPGDDELTLAYHGLTEGDLTTLPASVVGGHAAEGAANAKEALDRLREVYCDTVGYEDDHIQNSDERTWLREAVETRRFFQGITDADRRGLLESLTEVDAFEQFLHRTQPFQGEKRFSIEGLDAMVPMLQSMITETAHQGTGEVTIGMAHRGRLNVLTHVLKKPYVVMLGEFIRNKSAAGKPAVSGSGALGYTGDVKYHKGYHTEYHEDGCPDMPVSLAPNPSHLEFVNPVVLGRARAAQERRNQPGKPARNLQASLSILIHGDAAFPGQGVVAESLNLSQIPGYRVGGTIHIIANNQVGFTTDPRQGRSTMYASDLAKGFEIPIVHVNADDPEACLAIARMAVAYRHRFGKDFLIDLIGYRRWGHNETLEPRATQPMMYARIDAHPRPFAIWADRLIAQGVVTRAEADEIAAAVKARLNKARTEAIEAHQNPAAAAPTAAEIPVPTATVTAVTADRLRSVNAFLNAVPEGFTANEKQRAKFLQDRIKALDAAKPAINWAHAEALAFATLLEDGTPIRFSGQDSQAGTFSQRNLVLHDAANGKRYHPLRHLPTAKASIALNNSPLSETAALGFEYGYSVHAPETLVLWEAQFGDFANGGQVIIDQFIAAGKAKWGQTPSLVLLLPHGYEGQGPEHSSARLERFLQLCARDNMRVANCTTPAQYFHLLRRQAAQLQSDPRPLVVMTPKSFLRSSLSSLADLTDQTFQSVLDDPRAGARNAHVTRLVLCSGKVYFDVIASPSYAEAEFVAVARVEELYPFPSDVLRELFSRYPALDEVIWLQEEPRNMGAWSFAASRLVGLFPGGIQLRYAGRPEEASPAEGSQAVHTAQQAHIVAEALATPRKKNGDGHANGHRNGVGKIKTATEKSEHAR